MKENLTTDNIEQIEEVLDDADNLGLQFSRARRDKKISLDDAANSTKIKPSFIKAIERGDFDLLPGGIYTKGYVKTYSDFLGLQTPKIIAELENLESGGITGTMTPYAPQRSQRLNMRPANWLMGLCFLAIFAIVYMWNVRVEKNGTLPDSNMVVSPTEPALQPTVQENIEPVITNNVNPSPTEISNVEQQSGDQVKSTTAEPTIIDSSNSSAPPQVNEPDPLANLQQQLNDASMNNKKVPVESSSLAELRSQYTASDNNPVIPNRKILPVTSDQDQYNAQNLTSPPLKKIFKQGKTVNLIAKKKTKIFVYNKSGSKIFEQELSPGEIFVLPKQEEVKIKSDSNSSLDLKIEGDEAGNLGSISTDGSGMYSVRTIQKALSE
jgi:cytoskeletal protein RodZ